MKAKLTGTLGLIFVAASLHAQSVTNIVSSGLYEPNGVACALDTNNTYYIADGGEGNQIVKFSSSEGFVSLAGHPPFSGHADGAGSGALFNEPWGIVHVPARGGFVVSDRGNQLIRLVTTDGVVTTISGKVDPYGALVDGALNVAQFSFPSGLAADSKGNVYVADFGNGAVRQLGINNVVRTVSADFSGPQGIAVSAETNIWIADTFANVIKLVTLNTNTDTFTAPVKIAGNGFGYYGDNTVAVNAFFKQPRGLVWVGGKTGLVVSDTGNNAIRSVYFNPIINGYSVTTLTNGGFNAPLGLGYDNEGVIAVADSKASAVRGVVRALQPVPTMTPASGTYSNDVTVRFETTLDPKALPVFRYTTDGSAPTPVSAAGTTVTVRGGNNGTNVTVQARSFSPDYATSANVSNSFNFMVSSPVISPAGGSSDNPMLVTLSSETTNATLYWTINGQEPTTNSTEYQGAFLLETNGVLKVKGFRDGYATSATISNTFNLVVGDPVITPSGGDFNNTLSVEVSSSTAGAEIHYTTDGSEPTLSSPTYTTPVAVTQSLVFRAKALYKGMVPSQVKDAAFGLIVATPVISPDGGSSSNPIPVTLNCDTEGVALYWTVDGREPTTGSTRYTGPFNLLTNGTLKVKAFRDGFSSSATASADFKLAVSTPTLTASGSGINSNTVTLACATEGAIFDYTLDGSTPGVNNPNSYRASGPAATIVLTTNSILSVAATYAGFVTAPVVTHAYNIQVDTPVMSPAGGYFPSGGTVYLTVQRPGAKIYYTIDGSDPTNSAYLYDPVAGIKVDQVRFPVGDLHVIKARAFAPNTVPSAVVSGQSLETNSVGVPRDMTVGAGSTIVMPVVVNLSSNQQLRSLIFRLEAIPSGTNPAPAITTPMEALSISTNDFVPVVVNSGGTPASISYESYQMGSTNGIICASIATNLFVKDFGVIANVKVKIPSSAMNGQTYTVKVLEVSGTSDGGQGTVVVRPLRDCTLTVGSIPYLAGSSTPGAWYNAGDFGDPACATLNNADVNVAFEASLGVHTPYVFSDAFNAMDVYPETKALIGDGLITFLDWQHILKRSLRLETNAWVRVWTNGALAHYPVTPLAGTDVPPPVAGAVESCDVWLRQALIGTETLTNLVAGQAYSMPVYVRVLPGFEVNGLQFRGVLAAEGNAPEPGGIEFVPAGSMPTPMMRSLASVNEIGCAWSLGTLGSPLAGSNVIGRVQFVVPSTAQPGQRYTLRLFRAGGATDLDTELQIECASGSAWVASAPLTAPERVISDDWRVNFFGSVTNVSAGSEADPDGDGASNWQEYLAGTNPADRDSHLGFSGVERKSGAAVSLKWEAMSGRVYVVESSQTLGGPWTAATGNVLGEGAEKTFVETDTAGGGRFYRIRLLQQ